jgi:hypothetical protein
MSTASGSSCSLWETNLVLVVLQNQVDDHKLTLAYKVLVLSERGR